MHFIIIIVVIIFIIIFIIIIINNPQIHKYVTWKIILKNPFKHKTKGESFTIASCLMVLFLVIFATCMLRFDSLLLRLSYIQLFIYFCLSRKSQIITIIYILLFISKITNYFGFGMVFVYFYDGFCEMDERPCLFN